MTAFWVATAEAVTANAARMRVTSRNFMMSWVRSEYGFWRVVWWPYCGIIDVFLIEHCRRDECEA